MTLFLGIFLNEVFVGLDFPSIFVGQIKECIYTTTNSTANNGDCMNSSMAKEVFDKGIPCHRIFFSFEWNIFHVCQLFVLKITILIFISVVDCRLLTFFLLIILHYFSRGDFLSVRILMNTLQEFADCSVLQMNKAKSALFTVECEETTLEEIRQPIQSLGISFATKHLCVQDYTPLIEKITSNITV